MVVFVAIRTLLRINFVNIWTVCRFYFSLHSKDVISFKIGLLVWFTVSVDVKLQVLQTRADSPSAQFYSKCNLKKDSWIPEVLHIFKVETVVEFPSFEKQYTPRKFQTVLPSVWEILLLKGDQIKYKCSNVHPSTLCHTQRGVRIYYQYLVLLSAYRNYACLLFWKNVLKVNVYVAIRDMKY